MNSSKQKIFILHLLFFLAINIDNVFNKSFALFVFACFMLFYFGLSD